MMARSQRLNPVLTLARNRERQAAAAFARAQSALSRQEQTLAQLRQHQSEYHQAEQASGALSAGDMKARHAFFQRLSQAFQQQDRAIEEARQQMDRAREAWMHQRIRLQSLEKAQSRWKDEEARQADRLEQSRLDDLPGRWRGNE